MGRPVAGDAVRQADTLARQGRVPEAYRLLETAIAGGDALAAATLANWRLSGQIIRRDLGAARDLFGRAAALGLEEAAPIYIALLANGAGGTKRQWAQAIALLKARGGGDAKAQWQADLLDAMALTEVGDPLDVPPVQQRCAQPRVETVAGFMTPDECRYLVELATPMLQPSVVVHPTTGQFVRDPVRRAKSVGFPFVQEDPVLHAINRRIAAATGTRYDQGEPLQVLCYDPGDEYKLHVDALPPGNNQRVKTFLVALTADFDGGETSFPHLGLDWRGHVGDALHFANVDSVGKVDQQTQHTGKQVTRGRKYLLSKWIRAQTLDLAGPPNRPF